ncbi:MAG: Glycosyl transferase, group 2 family protein [uncultured Sulfurovum sp.]|uniref:Glycosyl transferase, group 2 family protein n=1 Tax=uncultured Sulfurovum sp. TaxID=269237 RepID=A0A6S6SVJ2_9BACT|nr:MAG: Glycosyl transferase, group 2 family protein [uncultured Sulfurovum sp.]
MKFQTLISTMDNYFFERNILPSSNFIVINQYGDKSLRLLNKENLFNMKGRGLAKSRNYAIAKASAEICHISDDDLEYIKNFDLVIENAFSENPEADIITFQVVSPEGEPFNNYKKNKFWHTKRTIMSVCSVEIAFRRESLLANKLYFDERFGLASNFPTGEEIIFLSDALDKGLKVLYIPEKIVTHPKESSGSNYGNERLLEAKGAMFYRIFGRLGYMATLLYAYKKHHRSPFSIGVFTKKMLTGIKKFRSMNE